MKGGSSRVERWQPRVLTIQAVYYLATGIWPLLSMSSFEAVTGPKTDDWLVRMVALLIVAISLTLIASIRRGRTRTLEVFVLAVASAGAFAVIDLWHALSGRISPVYLGDAAVEIVLIAGLVGLTRVE